MNDQQLEKKVSQDVAKVKKDLDTLQTDVAERWASRIEDNVSRAAEGLTTWVETGVSQLNEGFGKLTSNARQSVVSTTAAVKKDVGHGLIRYNAKAQDVADKVPGGIGKKAAKYPWVGMSITLLVGLLLGNFLKPARKPIKSP